jgi:hypothetical protein
MNMINDPFLSECERRCQYLSTNTEDWDVANSPRDWTTTVILASCSIVQEADRGARPLHRDFDKLQKLRQEKFVKHDKLPYIHKLCTDNRNTPALFAKLVMEYWEDLKRVNASSFAISKYHPCNAVPWLLSERYMYQGLVVFDLVNKLMDHRDLPSSI